MPTSDEVGTYREAQRALVTLAIAELVAWWRSLAEEADSVDVSAGLQRFMVALVGSFGSASASLAADWYDGLRDAAGVPDPFSALASDTLPAEQIEAGARWSVEPLFGAESDRDAALQRATGQVQRYVQQAGRDTITASAQADPGKPRWARVPQGETCAWCLILASRGAVYLSEQSAGELNRYHNDCDCQPTPTWDGSVPYDVDGLYALYNEARWGSRSGDIKKIAAWLRAEKGLR